MPASPRPPSPSGADPGPRWRWRSLSPAQRAPADQELETPLGWAADITLVATYPLLVAAALWPNAWAFGVLAVVGYLAEMRSSGYVVRALAQVAVGLTLRFAIREAALLLLLVRLGLADSAWFVGLAAGLLALHGVRGLHSGLALYVLRRRRLPVVTRGLDLSKLAIPKAPPKFLAERHVRTLLYLDVLPVIGADVGVIADDAVWAGVAGLAVAYAFSVSAIAVMARHAVRSRHLGNESRVLEVVNRQLRALKPEVVLYFSGALDMAYQVNMWVSTFDGLDRRGLIVLRERGMVDRLAPTTSPVVCVPAAADLAMLDLSSVSVAFFPANAAKNLHMLRIPGIKHVFLNHGDSDKEASFNPFTKVYDEVWVAGPAGRDRYREAAVGVRDEEIIEVGRPQLARVRVAERTPQNLTVLYAPTWEGLADLHCHSSVAVLGPALVRALLDHAPELRLLYKPHPLTGTRDSALFRAHLEIVAMIDRATAERAASGRFPAVSADAERRLAELTRRLASLTTTAAVGAADEAQLSRDAAGPDPARWAALQECAEAWNEAYWAAGGWWQHRVITGPEPHLYDCFNRCDLLITDISSVASDFIASGKPYAVTNVDGLDDERFRTQFPTAATGAYVINPDCAELPEILAEAVKDGADRMAAERRAHQKYLLGSDQGDAFDRFAKAVDTLIDTSAVRIRG